MMSGGVWKGIYKDRLYAFGWGLNMGRYELWKAYDGHDYGYSNFVQWNNLMGDPGTHIWTGLPDAIEVTHEASISLGESRFTVNVQYEDEDAAVVDALVCLYMKDELHLTAFTDDDGVTEFHIPSDALEEGNLMLTVTKHNHEPYLADVEVIEKEYYIGVSDWSVEDDEDTIPNPGENIELTLFMTNFGTGTPDGPITIAVESLSPWAEVTGEHVVEVEDVPEPGGSIDILMTVEINDSAPDEEVVLLAVNTSYDETTWYSVAALEIEAPRLTVEVVEIAEHDFGPGDHSDIYIEIGNAGRKAIADFSATLFCETDIIRIDNDEARYEGLEPDDSEMAADGMFAITAHPFSIPGMEVEAWLALESEEGFIDSISFRIPIGEAYETAPFGPDGYGYVCFDSGDEGWEMAPIYNWIEIDPDIDGNDFEGENTGLRDSGDNQDQSMVVALPFEFKYYGEVFHELTICTNGWAAFGNQRELSDFRNRRIAQALGPNAQLCVFWDNLMLANDSKILTYYDEEGGQFIIEWSKVHHLEGRVNQGPEETFQIILYDVRFTPTYSGDGIIVFQYKDVTNGATPAHNDTPYATIGISNLDDSDGLEYTYWNRFHPGAKRPLEDELALKFSNATNLITGVLSGRITDAFDGFPIPGAQITTSRGFWNVSNENGEYSIADILIGDGYTVTVRAQGYNDSTRSGEDGEGYTIIEDEITTADFALLHPEFNPSENSFEFLMLPDTTTESRFEVSNDGNGSLFFDSRYVYIFAEEQTRCEKIPDHKGSGLRAEEQTRDEPDEAWEMMLSWNVTDSVANQDQDPDYRINGVVYAEDAWIVSGSNGSNATENYFYIFDRWGNYFGRVVQPFEGYGAYDMDYYNGELYCTANDNTLYKVNQANGEILASYSLPRGVIEIRIITIDPATGHIYTGASVNRLYRLELTNDSLRINNSYITNDPRSNESIRRYGIAWFRDDPDGFNLYMFSNIELDADDEHPDISIFKMNPNNGEIRFVTDLAYLNPNYRGRGGIFITPKWNNLVWAFAAVIDNSGGDIVGVFEMAPNASWIDYSPRSDTLIAGESVNIDILIDTHNMEWDDYGVVIEFNHNAGEGVTHIPVSLSVGPYIVPEAEAVPLDWSLEQNHPNPFNPVTSISYSLKEACPIRLTVYDLTGREIVELVNEDQNAGKYRVLFNAKDMASGIYFYRIETTGFTKTRKMVLVK